MSEPTFELVTPSAVQALERAAVDCQISTAHAYPRSLADFKKRGLAMATMDLETAQSCIYQRPVGKGENGQQKIAEGESIRMAEIVAASFGNLRVGARIIEQTPQFVRAEGVAHDLESNYAGKSEVVESTVDRNGRPYSERQRTVVAKAALAKAYRDAIFKVVPRSMCKFIRIAAEQVIRKEALPLDQRRKRAMSWVRENKLDEKRFFSGLGIKGIEELNEDQLVTLTGIRTALKDGDTTIDEAFPELEIEAPSAPAAPPSPPTDDPENTHSRPTLVEEPISQEEKELAEAGLAPAPKQQQAPPPQKPAEDSPQRKLEILCDQNQVTFDEFRTYGAGMGWEADWDSLGGFEMIPTKLAEMVVKAQKAVFKQLGAWKAQKAGNR